VSAILSPLLATEFSGVFFGGFAKEWIIQKEDFLGNSVNDASAHFWLRFYAPNLRHWNCYCWEDAAVLCVCICMICARITQNAAQKCVGRFLSPVMQAFGPILAMKKKALSSAACAFESALRLSCWLMWGMARAIGPKKRLIECKQPYDFEWIWKKCIFIFAISLFAICYLFGNQGWFYLN